MINRTVGGTRTLKPFQAPVSETGVYSNSTTPASARPRRWITSGLVEHPARQRQNDSDDDEDEANDPEEINPEDQAG